MLEADLCFGGLRGWGFVKSGRNFARLLTDGRGYEQVEVVAEVLDGGVEGGEVAVGSGLHDAALHDGEDELG